MNPKRLFRTKRKLLIEALEDRRVLATATITPTADTFTKSSIGGGTATVLDLLDKGGGDQMAYVRFDLSELNISQINSATLTFRKISGTRNDTINTSRFDVFGLSNASGNTPQSWSESGLTTGTIGGEYSSTSGNGVDLNRVYNLDQDTGANVSEIVNNSIAAQSLTGNDLVSFLNDRNADGGLATFITLVDAGQLRGWGYGSRENTDSSLRPTLEIDYQETTPVGRQVERLDRGLIALRRSSTQAYVGWRLFGDDPTTIAFNLYRSTNGGTPVKLNNAPLTQTTDYVDSTVNLAQSNAYFIRPIIDGLEQDASTTSTIAANSPINQRISIPLQTPPGDITPSGEAFTYNANDSSVGDLNGDGDYEIILKWDPSNSKDNSQSGYTGNTLIDAYTLEGNLLWRIDLGRNIRAGAHYTQFSVYDFDGDGRSEIIMRTAPGTVDGQGNYVLLNSDNPNTDYRNASGYNITSPEYLTVFDGMTGAEVVSVPYLPDRVSASQWGDTYGNRVDRLLMSVAYLDGVHPSLVVGRGIFSPQSGLAARNELTAWDFDGNNLSLRWWFKAGQGINGNVNVGAVGQGVYTMIPADVDGDGYDEIVYGSMTVDHNGTLLYSSGLGHGDALHVSDMVPSNPGLEIFMPLEDSAGHGNIGFSVRDAATGTILISVHANNDVGRGVAGDIDPNSPGYEYWATTSYPNETPAIYSSSGTALYNTPSNMFNNFLVWWDGDLSRELLDSTTISKWNSPGRSNFDLDPATSGTQGSAPGDSSNNGTKSTPSLSADIFGDWREEVIWRRSDNTYLDIYTTVVPAQQRLYTLMHDVQYREAIAWQNVGYNQPPHPSFFVGTEMSTPPTPNIYYAGVVSPNHAPVFTSGGNVVADEDAGAVTMQWATAVGPGASSEASQALNFIVSNNNSGLFLTQPSIAANGMLSFRSTANAFGTAVVSVQLHDDGGTSNGGLDTSELVTFTITVGAVNDSPSFNMGANVLVLEDSGTYSALWATTLSTGPTNEASQTLTFSVSNNNAGLFAIQPTVTSAGVLAFTPAANANGFANVTVQLHDSGGTASGGVDASVSVTFTITVGPVNDKPSFTPGSSVLVSEDSGAYFQPWASQITMGPPNEAGQNAAFELSNDNASLFQVLPTIDASGVLSFVTSANMFGVAHLAVALRDNGTISSGGENLSDSHIFTITVSPVNDAPMASSDFFETAFETSLFVAAPGVLSNDLDDDGDTIAASLQTLPSHGSVSVGADGSFTYTPSVNYVGQDTFAYRVFDGQIYSFDGIVTVQVLGDTTKPVSQVVSVISNSQGLFTVNMSGSDAGGSDLAGFDLYVAVDGNAPNLISSVSAGSQVGGVNSGSTVYEGVTDGNVHSYRFFTRARDVAGNVEDMESVGDVTVTAVFAVPTNLTATAIDVQLGAKERSYIRFVDLLFNDDAGVDGLFAAGRIEVEKFSFAAPSVNAGTGTLIAPLSATLVDSRRLRLDFGTLGLGGSATTRTGDGLYRVRIDTNQDGDFNDASELHEFYRLLGDASGDGSFNVIDRSLVSRYMFDVYVGLDSDLNGDGLVNVIDRSIAQSPGSYQSIPAFMRDLLDD